MLLHDPSPRLRDRIVAHLSVHGPVSVQEMHAILNQRGHSYSVKAIYKELSILAKSGIILRSNRSYQLSLGWVFDAVSYTDALLARVGGQAFGVDLLPELNQSRTWKLREHTNVDRLWAQVTGVLLTKIEKPVIYQALQHRWWPLLHQNLGRQYREAMKKTSTTSLCVIGGNTYLDRLFMSYFPSSPSRCSNAPGFFKDKNCPSVTLIGDYVINATYPRIFLTELDQYFNRIQSKREVVAGDIQHLFRSTGVIGVITFRIEHNKSKALLLRRKFNRYFEV